jgi:hypothetical protein
MQYYLKRNVSFIYHDRINYLLELINKENVDLIKIYFILNEISCSNLSQQFNMITGMLFDYKIRKEDNLEKFLYLYKINSGEHLLLLERDMEECILLNIGIYSNFSILSDFKELAEKFLDKEE